MRLSLPPEDGPPVSLKALDWKRLFIYLRPYQFQMALAILALLASAALGLAFPLIIVRLLESVTGSRNLSTLNSLAGLLFAVFLAQAAFSFLQSSLLALVGERIVRDLRTSLYRNLHEQSLDFFASRRVGEIVSRLSSDVTQMRTVLTGNITTLLSQTVSLTGALVIVIRINPRLTLFILALVPLLIVLGGLFGKRIHNAGMGVQDELAASTTVAEEALQAIRVVKSFGRERYETERYGSAVQKAFRASVRLAISQSLFVSMMMFLGLAAIGAIVWYGGSEVIAGRLTLAMISGFLMYGILIAGSLAGLGGVYGQFRAAIGGVQRIFEILDLQPTVLDAPGAFEMPPAEGRLQFDRVLFQYEANVPVLRGITLDIHPGEILAIVGPSGAGKSTLFNLIPRFYDPCGGSVRIDGHDLRSVTRASLRDQIAIVPQECMLFGGTIRENIRYGRLDATEEEIVAASRAANAHDFVMEFPLRYETVVGERGTKLSGGQRQRVAIARAILKNPRILLLDEATSSLDNEAEALVQEALNRLMKQRTTVMIAHRLSTIKMADRIAVLEAGHIIELGTHGELMSLNGRYGHLYSMQFREMDSPDAPSPEHVLRKGRSEITPILSP